MYAIEGMTLTYFGDPLTFPLVPPASQDFWILDGVP